MTAKSAKPAPSDKNKVPGVKQLVAGQKFLKTRLHESIRTVARAMPHHHSSAAIIVDEDERIIGIVSERALVERALALDIDVDETPISSIMTRKPITIAADAGIRDAFDLMLKHDLRTVPVVENGVCIGIVDIRNLYAGMHKLLEEQHRQDESLIHYAFGEAYSVSKK